MHRHFTPLVLTASLALLATFSCDGRTRAPGYETCQEVDESITRTCRAVVDAIAAGDGATMLSYTTPDAELFVDVCGVGDCKQAFYQSPKSLEKLMADAGGLHAAYGLPPDQAFEIFVTRIPGPKPRLTVCASDGGGQKRLCLNVSPDRINSMQTWVQEMGPDPDADGYGVFADQCPTAPEDYNGVKDEDGCADSGAVRLMIATPTAEALDVENAMTYEEGALSKEAKGTLDAVHAAARAHNAAKVLLECPCAEGDTACADTCQGQLKLVFDGLKERGETTVYADVVIEAQSAPGVRIRLGLKE